MLSKKNRLSIGEFPPQAEVLFRGNTLLIKEAPNREGCVRIGVSAPAGRIKKATTRNAVRRHITTRLRGAVKDMDINKKGKDLLIIVTTPIIKLGSKEKSEIEKDLAKAEKVVQNK